MTESTNALLNFKVGNSTIAQNLHNAVTSGALLKQQDGYYELPKINQKVSPWLKVLQAPGMDCHFLMHFLFKQAYGRSIVPLGCQNCYKVCIVPKNVRELMALRSLQVVMNCEAKCGVELDHSMSQNIYSGFFYCNGLDEARAVYQKVRYAINEHPKLGPAVAMHIKRGCTVYEVSCGPSDQFSFAPELVELEAHLSRRFKRPANVSHLHTKQATQVLWLHTAFSIGDDSYLEFTGGKRLYPKTVTYEPYANPEIS